MNQPLFDYRNQAWTAMVGKTRVYLACGHPETMDCGCYGRAHAGEALSESERVRVIRENGGVRS